MVSPSLSVFLFFFPSFKSSFREERYLGAKPEIAPIRTEAKLPARKESPIPLRMQARFRKTPRTSAGKAP